MTTTNNLYVLRSEIEKVFIQMIFDANASMYPEGKVLEMKEFNMFSCGKASIEIAKDRVMKIPTINPLDTTISEIDKMQEEIKKSPDYMNDKLAGPTREKLLEELKSRLLSRKL